MKRCLLIFPIVTIISFSEATSSVAYLGCFDRGAFNLTSSSSSSSSSSFTGSEVGGVAECASACQNGVAAVSPPPKYGNRKAKCFCLGDEDVAAESRVSEDKCDVPCPDDWKWEHLEVTLCGGRKAYGVFRINQSAGFQGWRDEMESLNVLRNRTDDLLTKKYLLKKNHQKITRKRGELEVLATQIESMKNNITMTKSYIENIREEVGACTSTEAGNWVSRLDQLDLYGLFSHIPELENQYEELDIMRLLKMKMEKDLEFVENFVAGLQKDIERQIAQFNEP